MKNKLEKRIDGVKDEHAKEVLSEIESRVGEEKKDLLLFTLGKVNLADNLSTALNAQTVRALQHIREEHLYRSAGFNRFDDFLDEYPHSPMNYKKFNSLERLLETEGDTLFNSFTSLSIPTSKRKLIGKGNIQLEGATVIIKGDNGEEFRFELTERNRILETLSALADANAEKSSKLDKQKQKIERGESEIESLQKKLDDAKNRPGEMSAHSLHYEDFMRVCSAIETLAETVKKLPADEREQYRELYLRSLSGPMERLKNAYHGKPLVEMDDGEREKHIAKKVKNNSGRVSDNDRIAEIVSSMNDEELEAMMN